MVTPQELKMGHLTTGKKLFAFVCIRSETKELKMGHLTTGKNCLLLFA